MGEVCGAIKGRGAFFTPSKVADFLAAWAIRSADDTILEPSCGEAVFLSSAVACLRSRGCLQPKADQLWGVDIHERSVHSARRSLTRIGAAANLLVRDFFAYRTKRRFDAVIGNPPYVRYQRFTGADRDRAFLAALRQKVRLSALASSWAAFLVHASSFLKPDGRLALVLPAELTSVNYAAPVREFLMNRFSQVGLIFFEERAFPGVLQEVLLLLAEGQGGTDEIKVFQTQNFDGLDHPEWSVWKPPLGSQKWSSALLPHEYLQTYQELTERPSFSTLLDWGETNLGMVTGRNRFFTLNAKDVVEFGLHPRELLRISPPGSRHLRGLSLSHQAWEELRRAESRVYLFDPDPQCLSEASQSYIAEGEARDVHQAYKCRVRIPWWKVPKVQVPDLFLTYMNHDTPRLTSNQAKVHYLNSIHGLTLRQELRSLGTNLLPIAALNSLTVVGAELVGRSYGGGILKLEPKEADRLPVPSASLIRRAESDLRALIPQLARHLRSGDLDSVIKLVDRTLLMKFMRVSSKELGRLREARRQLFSRRVARSRKVP